VCSWGIQGPLPYGPNVSGLFPTPLLLSTSNFSIAPCSFTSVPFWSFVPQLIPAHTFHSLLETIALTHPSNVAEKSQPSAKSPFLFVHSIPPVGFRRLLFPQNLYWTLTLSLATLYDDGLFHQIEPATWRWGPRVWPNAFYISKHLRLAEPLKFALSRGSK
jgi:hypothetical protein